ncbi:MAG: tetratricopeptide repeat protein [candidate division NC10 bacterium]|nr:tetratricopeptide repeat protein [candidate division NC10 bacterium]
MRFRRRRKGNPLVKSREGVRMQSRPRAGGRGLWALVSVFLPFVLLWWGSCGAWEDYEFRRIQEAFQLQEMVFQVDRRIPVEWERGKEMGSEASRELLEVLLLRQAELEGNPFYHLSLGEAYFRQEREQRAQEEWARASALAGDDPFQHWLLLRGLYRMGRPDPARMQIREMQGIQGRVAGPRRLPFLASQAIQLAEELKDRRPLDSSLELVDLALFLDPRSAEGHFVKASLLGRMGVANLGEALREVFSGILLALREGREALLLRANLLSALVTAYFVLFFLYGATLFLKYEPLIRHELGERTRIATSPLTGALLLGFFYFLPLFLSWGANWLLFFWILLLFPFCLGKERVVLSLLMFALLLLPSFYQFAASAQMARVDPLIEAVIQVEEGRQGEGAADYLAQQVARQPEDSLSRFYLGLALKGEWKLGAAGEEFRTYLERVPHQGAAHNNLGNLYFLQKRYEEAEAEYKKAIEVNPEAASPHANLSLLYASFPKRLRIEEAEAEMKKAEALDPGITRRMGSYQGMAGEPFLIDENLPKRELWGRILGPSPEKDLLAEALWGHRIRFLSLRSLRIWPWILIALLWVSNGLRSRGPSPRFCQSCGKAFCDLCERGSARTSSCSACYAIFYSHQGVTPQMRIERLLCKDRHGEWEKWKVRLLSFFPGASSFYLGRSGSGLFQSGLFFLLLFYGSRWSEITPAPFPFLQTFPFLWGALFLTPLLILYIASLARGLRWSP